jgi:hypothetical protein
MRWSFRRAVNLGPLRINLSKSGIGYSVGGHGFRTGMRSSGRRYSRVSIPGTGISYTTSGGQGTRTGCLLFLAASIGAAGAFIVRQRP